jgi:hypothetical protein
MKKKSNNHLAEGEVTGHFHAATGDDVEVFEEAFGDSSLKLNAPNGSAITHQEHGTIEIPAGSRRTGRILEFDPAAEEAREVQD